MHYVFVIFPFVSRNRIFPCVHLLISPEKSLIYMVEKDIPLLPAETNLCKYLVTRHRNSSAKAQKALYVDTDGW